MRIRYLGTSAAEGFPAVFCNCEACRKAREKGELRTRSQVLIDGDLLVDFPPDTFYHAVRYNVDLSAVSCLLVTHSHTDHFYAQEFVNRGYKFAYGMREKELSVYGNEAVYKVFNEGIAREIKEEVRRDIRFTVVKPYAAFVHKDYEIHVLPANHTPAEQALLYYIRKGGKGILYFNDTGLPQQGVYSYLSERGLKADLVSFDCTLADRADAHSGRHMNIYENLAVLEKLKDCGAATPDTRCVITHFSHNSEPFRERMEALASRYGFIAAHDGMVLEI